MYVLTGHPLLIHINIALNDIQTSEFLKFLLKTNCSESIVRIGPKILGALGEFFRIISFLNYIMNIEIVVFRVSEQAHFTLHDSSNNNNIDKLHKHVNMPLFSQKLLQLVSCYH